MSSIGCVWADDDDDDITEISALSYNLTVIGTKTEQDFLGSHCR